MVRLKHRYLTVHVLYPPEHSGAQTAVAPLLQFHRASPAGVDAGHLLRLIRQIVEFMYGDYGLGLIASSLKINYWSAATSTAIIRVTRNHFRILWGALTWITDIGKTGGHHKGLEKPKACVFRVVRNSGTIRKAEEDVIRRAKEEILRAKESNLAIGMPGLPMETVGMKAIAKSKASNQNLAEASDMSDASDDEDQQSSGIGKAMDGR